MSKNRNVHLPLWRVLLGIILAVVATGLLIYGSVTLTAKAAISKQMIEETVNGIDLMEEYGEDATKAINVGIMHLTNSAYTDHLYLDRSELRSYLDDQEIKRFIIQKVSEFSAVITSDTAAMLTAEEISPFLEKVRLHAEQETGLQITNEQAEAEIRKAIDGDQMFSEYQLIYPGRALLCIVLGAFLLLSLYLILWPKFGLSSILCAGSVVLICIVLFATGSVITNYYDVSEVVNTFGSGAFSFWVEKIADLFKRRGLLSLLGVVFPLGVMVAYCADAAHVARLKSNSGRY